MRRLALAISLACVLAGATRAGEIHPTGAVAPPPPPPSTTPAANGASAPGEIHSTGSTEPEESSALLTIILTFISIVR